MKIDIKQTLAKTVSFYKTNFRRLAVISFAKVLYVVLMQIITWIPMLLGNNAILLVVAEDHAMQAMMQGVLAGVLSLVLLVTVIMFIPGIYLSMPVTINALLAGEGLSFRETYRRTKYKRERYWGSMLLMALWYIPLLVLQQNVPFVSQLSVVYTAFITTIYYTLLPMIAIEPPAKHYLRRSAKMIKGNYLAALTLTLVTVTTLSVFNGVFTNMLYGNSMGQIVAGVMYVVALFFVQPFNDIAAVIVYKQLVTENQITV